MTVMRYKSTTAYGGQFLDITEEMDSRYTKYVYRGFDSVETAQQFAESWKETWGWAYFPMTEVSVDDEDGTIAVFCSRYNSCD